MPTPYERNIHFADTDAAGVVFFANYLALAHEAYEESLGASGINLSAFFRDNGVIVPVSQSEAEYRRPLHCGDRIRVDLSPRMLSENSFEIRYEITRLTGGAKNAARLRTEHVCIDSASRARKPVPAALAAWIAGATTP